jgi:ribosome small subunit-dependent GTPase A
MLQNGRILSGLGGSLYQVRLDDGTDISCYARGLFRYKNETVNVGDYVIIEPEPDGSAAIRDIIDRKNLLIRPPIANLDILFVVIAAASPEPFLTTTDKMISIAEYSHIEPVVIVTKSDLDAVKADYIASIYKKSGFNVFMGTDNLTEFIESHGQQKTAAFAGASGVGKSTLLNKLFPKRVSLSTGDISRKTSRGKHTTRHVELFPISELTDNSAYTGYLADTPGFSLLDFIRFDFFDKDDLIFTFREFDPYITTCRYTKCTHTKEEGCAIIEAVKNGIIPVERHNSYVEIYNDLKDKRAWKK